MQVWDQHHRQAWSSPQLPNARGARQGNLYIPQAASEHQQRVCVPELLIQIQPTLQYVVSECTML